MRDIELFIMLKEILETAEPLYGIPANGDKPGVEVYQSFQPGQQGVPTGPSAFLEIISHRRVGRTYVSNIYDEEQSKEIQTELQQMITTFQLSALATQDPESLVQMSAGDIVNLMAMILQSTNTIAQIEAAGCGMLLAGDTRNPKFLDDRGRFESNPSLDFSITHKLIVSREVPVLQSQELEIYRV